MKKPCVKGRIGKTRRESPGYSLYVVVLMVLTEQGGDCNGKETSNGDGSISQDAVAMLTEMEAHRSSDYVFPSSTGGPISPDSVNNMLHRVLKRAGLPSIRFHDLRHTFATLALQNGVDIKTVSGMLGHFSAGFTLDTYAHVTTSAQKEAAKTMGKVLAVE